MGFLKFVEKLNQVLDAICEARCGGCEEPQDYKVPDMIEKMVIYYGWLNSFNSAVNGWDNEKVSQDLARYSVIVIGDGIQEPTHGDYANSQSIINRIKVLNPPAKIFGYVTINQSYEDFKAKVDKWNTMGVHGIFLDEAGYDYGTAATNGRAAFNSKVDYVHSMTSSNICFANAWKLDYVLGTEDNVSFPNSTYNPDLLQSNLASFTDWVLLESFAITSTPAFEPGSQWKSRGEDAVAKKEAYNINIAAVSVIADNDTNGQDKYNFLYTSAIMWDLNAVGASDAYYGAGSAKCKWYDSPSAYPAPYYLSGKVESSGNKYFRYFVHGKFEVDFTFGSETSSISIY